MDHADEKMASAVIQLGRSLGLQLVAEGVETREQLDRMRALGCDAVQGFLLGPPVRQSAVAGVIQAHRGPVQAAPARSKRAQPSPVVLTAARQPATSAPPRKLNASQPPMMPSQPSPNAVPAMKSAKRITQVSGPPSRSATWRGA